MAREIALLTNPNAGVGRGSRSAAAALPRLREAGFFVRQLVGRGRDETVELAAAAVAERVEVLVVCGGDGMVQLGAEAVVGTETTLGIIPAGTGNDVARYLGIPRNDPQRAADVVVASRTREMDLGRVGSRHFVTVLASGFDAAVNQRANGLRWPRGQMRYALAALAEVGVFRPIGYTVESDGEVRHVEAMLVAVANGPTYGGGLRIAAGAAFDDGRLDVVVVEPMSRRELVRAYPRLYTGGIVGHPRYRRWTASSVTVAAADVVAYADGERFGGLPLTVEIAPRAVRVLAPS